RAPVPVPAARRHVATVLRRRRGQRVAGHLRLVPGADRGLTIEGPRAVVVGDAVRAAARDARNHDPRRRAGLGVLDAPGDLLVRDPRTAGDARAADRGATCARLPARHTRRTGPPVARLAACTRQGRADLGAALRRWARLPEDRRGP